MQMKKSKPIKSIWMKSIWIANGIEKQPLNVFLTKPNGKGTQPNKEVVRTIGYWIISARDQM